VSLTQVHGNAVVEVTPNASKAIEADGLWTRSSEAALAVTVADCVPLVFAHASGAAVAAVHAGWRGTVAKIATEMVHRFKKAGFPPDELLVAMGPAIGPCCFEVGSEVLEAIREAFPGVDSLMQADASRGYANLWDLNRMALEEAGVMSSQVDILSRCTSCSPDFFSYRRDRGATGRQCGIIARS
jgi:YfiH family protein